MGEGRAAATALCNVVAELTSCGNVPRELAAKLVIALAELLRVQEDRVTRLEKTVRALRKRQRSSARRERTESNGTASIEEEEGSAMLLVEAEGTAERTTKEMSAITAKPLPALPTVNEVRDAMRERTKRCREEERRAPLPCERCRKKKREMMLEERGCVKEDVFERWASKPGACIEFVHQDEPVLKRDTHHDLSFPESATQSPSLEVSRKEY